VYSVYEQTIGLDGFISSNTTIYINGNIVMGAFTSTFVFNPTTFKYVIIINLSYPCLVYLL